MFTKSFLRSHVNGSYPFDSVSFRKMKSKSFVYNSQSGTILCVCLYLSAIVLSTLNMNLECVLDENSINKFSSRIVDLLYDTTYKTQRRRFL